MNIFKTKEELYVRIATIKTDFIKFSNGEELPGLIFLQQRKNKKVFIELKGIIRIDRLFKYTILPDVIEELRNFGKTYGE